MMKQYFLFCCLFSSLITFAMQNSNQPNWNNMNAYQQEDILVKQALLCSSLWTGGNPSFMDLLPSKGRERSDCSKFMVLYLKRLGIDKLEQDAQK